MRLLPRDFEKSIRHACHFQVKEFYRDSLRHKPPLSLIIHSLRICMFLCVGCACLFRQVRSPDGPTRSTLFVCSTRILLRTPTRSPPPASQAQGRDKPRLTSTEHRARNRVRSTVAKLLTDTLDSRYITGGFSTVGAGRFSTVGCSARCGSHGKKPREEASRECRDCFRSELQSLA